MQNPDLYTYDRKGKGKSFGEMSRTQEEMTRGIMGGQAEQATVWMKM